LPKARWLYDIAGSDCAANVETLSLLLTYGGLLVALLAMLSVLVIAFNVSIGWLIACFLPFGKIVFAIRHWEEARGAVLTYFFGLAMMLSGALVDPHLGDKDDDNPIHAIARVFRSSGPSPTPSNTVALREDRITVLQGQLAQGTADLNVMYREISVRRAALKPGDEKALAEYNAEAARYAALLEYTRKVKTELDELMARLH
jgi:hypothetical protein